MTKQTRCGNSQRRMAAAILKCGEGRVWIDPSLSPKIKSAITRVDVRRLIRKGMIKKKKAIIQKTKRKTRRQRDGSRKGKRGAREGKKTDWLKVVRPQRRVLKELKTAGKLTEKSYRKTYLRIKGGSFRSKAHLMLFLKDKKLLKEDKDAKSDK